MYKIFIGLLLLVAINSSGQLAPTTNPSRFTTRFGIPSRDSSFYSDADSAILYYNPTSGEVYERFKGAHLRLRTTFNGRWNDVVPQLGDYATFYWQKSDTTSYLASKAWLASRGYAYPIDTAAMLANYARAWQFVRYSDTAAMVSNRLKISDTAFAHSGYQRKNFSVLYTDSALMLSPYLRSQRLLDSLTAVQARIQTKQPFGNYLVAGNNLADVTNVSTARTNLGVLAIADTAAMLSNRLKISDTASMLSHYARINSVFGYVNNQTGAPLAVQTAKFWVTDTIRTSGIAVSPQFHANTSSFSPGTTDVGVLLDNLTAATNGNQSFSPMLTFKGKGWKTFAGGSSEDLVYQMFVAPVQSAFIQQGAFKMNIKVGSGTETTILDHTLSAGSSSLTAATWNMLGNLAVGGTITSNSVNVLTASDTSAMLSNYRRKTTLITNSDLATSYLPLTASPSNKLTGDLYINKANPSIVIQGASLDMAIYGNGNTLRFTDNSTGTKGFYSDMTTGALTQLGTGALTWGGSITGGAASFSTGAFSGNVNLSTTSKLLLYTTATTGISNGDIGFDNGGSRTGVLRGRNNADNAYITIAYVDASDNVQLGGASVGLKLNSSTGAATFAGSVTGGAASFSTGAFSSTVTSSVSSGYNLSLNKAGGAAILFQKTNATAQDWAINPDDNFKIYDITGGITPFIITKGTGAATFSGSVTGGAASFTASSQPSTFISTNATTGYNEYRYNTSTTAGYIGNGSGILSGAANSDFIFRSEGAVKLAYNGNNLGLTINSSGVTGGAATFTTGNFTGTVNINNTSAAQAQFYGYSDFTSQTYDGKTAWGSSTGNQGVIQYSSAGQTVFYIDNTYNSASAAINFRLRTAGTPVVALSLVGSGAATFVSSVTATAFYESSDLRLKNVLSKDGDMITFKWKKGDERVHYGYIAQEVQRWMPDAVNEGNDGFLSVNYTEVLVKKVNELEKSNASLLIRITQLENRLR